MKKIFLLTFFILIFKCINLMADPQKDMFNAIKNNNIKELIKAINNKADVNKEDEN